MVRFPMGEVSNGGCNIQLLQDKFHEPWHAHPIAQTNMAPTRKDSPYIQCRATAPVASWLPDPWRKGTDNVFCAGLSLLASLMVSVCGVARMGLLQHGPGWCTESRSTGRREAKRTGTRSSRSWRPAQSWAVSCATRKAFSTRRVLGV